MRRNSPQAASARLNEQLADLGPLRLQDMDAAGIDFQVISHGVAANTSLPHDEIVHLMQAANDQLATAIMAHPDRFAGFAALPMTNPQAAVAELKRAVQSLGFKGAMINGT
ncbi:MAG: amidohydrolase family protein, partial [Ktedonobacteraceae bacterium]|nr:amidohydrolase family protein [Ktedonobacteraceae bacterium]